MNVPAEDQPLGGSDGDISELADGNWPTQPQAADGIGPTQPTEADANGATQQTAADGIGPTQPTAAGGFWTTPPNPPTISSQSASTDQLMFMMGQLMAQQNTQQEAMMKLMAEREAGSSRSSNGLSTLARSVNTSGLLRCDEYHGEKEKFLSWKRVFYSSLELLDPHWVPKLKVIEINLDDKLELIKMTDTERDQAKGVSAFLIHLCKGDAATRINSSEDGNGFEMWRMLCKGKLARSSIAAMNSIMNPIFTSEDPRIRMQVWDKDVERFEARFGEKVNESLRKSIYQEKIAPAAMHEHLLLNQSRFPTAEDIKDQIEEYLDAREESEQTRSTTEQFVASTTEQFVAGIHGKGPGKGKGKKGDGVLNKFGKDKGKKGDKHGKGQHGKGKEDAKGKSKDKGKLHKSVGKYPERSQAAKFGGKCNYCWRIGHKEAQCWFRQAYEKYNKGEDDDSKRKQSDSGSGDIRDYMQNKKPRHGAAGEDGKMEIGGIMVEERFIYAVFDGDFDEIECQTCGEEETDDARSQIVWWKAYFNQKWEPDCPEEDRPMPWEQSRSVKIGPVMELETVEEEDYAAVLERHWTPGGRIWVDAEPESIEDEDAPESIITENSWEEIGRMQDAVIYEFLNSEQQQEDCHYIFSIWNLPEEGEVQDLPDEDEEDEDNGLAQSLAVTTQASSSARRSNVVEVDMEMEDQERALLEAESEEEEKLEAESEEEDIFAKNAKHDQEMYERRSSSRRRELFEAEIQERLEEGIQERLGRVRKIQDWHRVLELVRQRWQREELLEKVMIKWYKSTILVKYASPKARFQSWKDGEMSSKGAECDQEPSSTLESKDSSAPPASSTLESKDSSTPPVSSTLESSDSLGPQFWPRAPFSTSHAIGSEKCLACGCGEDAELMVRCRSENCPGTKHRAWCKLHLQGWKCENCGDAGSSGTASLREEEADESLE